MRRRSGFTLVEVLVAMALILFIMTILAAAFGAATGVVSDLKSAGDLAERLRGAATVLKRDLEANHCFDANGNPLRISSLWNQNANNNPPPPTFGFFRIFQGQQDVIEGATAGDLDNIPSFFQTTTALHYTISLSGVRRGDFLSAAPPVGSPLLNPADPVLGLPDTRYADTPNTSNPQVFTAQTAEVAIFLAPTGDLTAPANGATLPLFALYRRQFVTTPDNWAPAAPVPDPAAATIPSYIETSNMANVGPNLVFNSMRNLTLPVHRFSMNRANPAGVYQNAALSRYTMMGEDNQFYRSADLLMTDVVSFDVRVLLAGDSEFRDLFDPIVQQFAPPNPAFAGNGPRVFDTWSSQTDLTLGVDYSTWDGPWLLVPQAPTAATIPLYKTPGLNGTTISIKAIQIALRVWDYKTKKTRQVTIVQQM